ncbi:MAG TPA: YvcK family protein [Candidatus Moranbacteria bacterium]|nr:YvcK family protein [Candidatus Moranbacteria bacterium]HSA07870.1 YvcK family protein [Candidatus Moranbacteria bacterium]
MTRKKIVTIGGGTGSFTLLGGLKKYPVDISAIVSMMDDGGSTGILRDELGVLPPGDVRQCLVALSDSSEMLRKLMNYRFDKGGLKGHNFGNIFLSALEKINGNFSKGVEQASQILNVKGEVIPVTDDDTNLFLQLQNGKLIKGENEINHNFEIEKIGIKKIYLNPRAKASKKAVQRILEADLIVIGPGNYYCSIVPNFLVKGISEAVARSKAKVVFNCNLVNKRGQTEKFDLDEYLKSINKFIGKDRIDFVVFNTKKPSQDLIKKYANKGEHLIEIKKNNLKRKYKIIRTNVLGKKEIEYNLADALLEERSLIRHDSEKLAKVLMKIVEQYCFR